MEGSVGCNEEVDVNALAGAPKLMLGSPVVQPVARGAAKEGAARRGVEKVVPNEVVAPKIGVENTGALLSVDPKVGNDNPRAKEQNKAKNAGRNRAIPAQTGFNG